jgi:hypothetical protein
MSVFLDQSHRRYQKMSSNHHHLGYWQRGWAIHFHPVQFATIICLVRYYCNYHCNLLGLLLLQFTLSVIWFIIIMIIVQCFYIALFQAQSVSLVIGLFIQGPPWGAYSRAADSRSALRATQPQYNYLLATITIQLSVLCATIAITTISVICLGCYYYNTTVSFISHFYISHLVLHILFMRWSQTKQINTDSCIVIVAYQADYPNSWIVTVANQ